MPKIERNAPETPATKWLRRHDVPFSTHVYEYEEHGGTAVSARALNLPEHAIVKTLVMHDENARPLIVLMHGDCEVSTKELARQSGRKRIEICPPAMADRHSGYRVGGTSPFATKKTMPVFMEKSIADLPLIYINGGRRGFLVGIHPHDLIRLLAPEMVTVTQKNE
ncbi:MAG: Cys-tRNA(Pro) deacylase [Azoarcus sp.]|nr:Cys-tRNA(Pro) deacylase [Azoarcus sp.]